MTDPYELMRQNGACLRSIAITNRTEGNMTATPAGARMLSEAGGLLVNDLRAWRKATNPKRGGTRTRAAQLLDDVGVDRACALTTEFLVNNTTKEGDNYTVLRLRRGLGTALEREAAWVAFRKASPVGFSYRIRDYQKAVGASKAHKERSMRESLSNIGEALDWDNKDRTVLAALLIDRAVKSTGIFTNKKERHGGKIKDIIQLHPAVLEWVEAGEAMLGTLVAHLPITERPIDWAPGVLGGFDVQKVPPIPFMSGRSNSQQRALLNSDCPAVYQAVNTLQATQWRVNKTTNMLLRHVTDNGWSGVGLPAHPGERYTPPAKPYEKGDPDWVEHTRKMRAWHIASDSFHKAAARTARTLSTSKAYAPLPHFHMVHTVDWRGRCYPQAGALGYQGAEHQRAMVEFARPEPVGEGLEWFLITGANLFGVDKVPLEDRVAWVKTNTEELIATGQNPTSNRMWMEADKPFQFAAWAAEYARFQHEGESFMSHLPIGVDGSSNGLQIYSLLLRDAVGGSATNCTPSGAPRDIYQLVADKATEMIRQKGSVTSDPRERRWCRQILAFCKTQGFEGLPRKAAKRPTMVLPYGGTLYSCQGYLSEWYTDIVRGRNIPEDEHPFPQRDAFQALNFLGAIMWDALGEVVVKAREAMDWMHKVSDIVSSEGAHAAWTTPLGLRCQQSYRKGKKRRVSLMSGSRINLQVWDSTDKVDTRKSRNGFAPNYIHSLDAAAMMHTTNLLSTQGVTDYRMIHDDYGTHARHAVTLGKTLRYAYVDIFRHDLLQALHAELTLQLPGADIPPPPSEGNLALDSLLNSKYFFA